MNNYSRTGVWDCADKCGYTFVGTPEYNPFFCPRCKELGNPDVTMIQTKIFANKK